MPDVRLPLSGDVTQTINPWTFFFNPVGNQFGTINVNLGQSADPATERAILEDVGSYGRQIGRIGDALRVLLDHVPLTDLQPEETSAIEALRSQLDSIEAVKTKARRTT